MIYVLPNLVNAQIVPERFGKNRIQTTNYNWKFVTSTNFDVYFSDGGYDNAVLAAKYAEIEYQKIIGILDYSPYHRIKLIIYNSHHNLLESNIQAPEQNPVLGGQTDFINSKIEIPFEGDQLEFRKNISEGISKYLLLDMMYGGSLKNMYRNNIFLQLPDWFLSGLASYIARGWDNELDDYMRDIFSNRKVNSPNSSTELNQKLIGQSVWHYISEAQGKNTIANILTLARISRNYEIAIGASMGVNFKTFELNWRTYFRKNADVLIDHYVLVDASKAIRKNRTKYDYYQVKASPDGKLVAYSENDQGKYRVYVRDVKTGKTYHFLTGGYKTNTQLINNKTPLLAWKSDRVLSVIETKNNKIQMITREISGGRSAKKVFGTFDQVIDFDYSDDGNNIIFSAEKEGKSDLFIFTVKSNQIKQITNDLYDERHPVFLKGSLNFVFSSNRNTDTIKAGLVKLNTLQDNTELYLYDVAFSTTVFKKLTNTNFHENNPVSLNSGEIAYIQDESGIFNLAILDLNTGTSKLISNFQQNILHFDASYNKNFSFVMLNNNRELLFSDFQFDLKQDLKIQIKTPRRETFNFIEKIFNIGNEVKVDTIKVDTTSKASVILPQSNTIKTNSKSHINEDEITFGSNEMPSVDTTVQSAQSEEIDVNNYRFESEQKSAPSNENSLKSNGIVTKVRSEDNIKISNYKPIKHSLSLTQIVTSLVFDPLRGFGTAGETELRDMHENHRFKAFAFSKFDLTSNTIIAEYEYLKKRIDYKFKFEKHRLSVYDSSQTIESRVSLDKIEFSFTYPINTFARVSLSPFAFGNGLVNILPGFDATKNSYYSGVRAEYVFDNTVSTGMNMMYGTRYRLTAENYVGMSKHTEKFTRLELDFRHYQKIHKEIILAGAVTAGTYYGSKSPQYIVGGMSNTILAPRASSTDTKNPLFFDSNADPRMLLIDRFIANIRGFDYGQIYGSNQLVANVELRIPIVKYLYKRVINSDMLRNLQIIGFYDIGTAWTGTNPFNSENSYNTTTKKFGDNFSVKVINFKNPFISSFGSGIHTHFSGYYVKVDLAFPMQDYVYKTPKLIFSLGFDF